MLKHLLPLRLIYPQWQGGIVAHWVPDIPADDVSRGYYLGSHLLNYLAPQSGQRTVEVPVSLDINDREEENGISSYQAMYGSMHILTSHYHMTTIEAIMQWL